MIVNASNIAAMNQGFNMLFKKGLAGVESMWPQVAQRVPSSSAKENYPWLSAMPRMKEWLGDRQIENLSASNYELVNHNYEDTFEIDRNEIQDDKYGVYGSYAEIFGRSAMEDRDYRVFAALAAGFATVGPDGQYFIDDDHPVGSSTQSNDGGGASTAWYLMDLSKPVKPLLLQIRQEPEFVAQVKPTDEAVFMRRKFRYGVDDRKAAGYGFWQLVYGSKQTLSADYYATARAAMMGLTDDAGRPLAIRPTHLVVPPSLEETAREILEGTIKEGTSTAKSNPWKGTAQVLVVPWLS